MASVSGKLDGMSGMLGVAQEHERLELRLDYDELMDTLVENPVYYWFPRGIRIEGRAAVREMYDRLKPMIVALDEATRAGTRSMDFFALGENQLAAEVQFDFPLSTGATKRVRIAAFVPFEGDLMIGETQYVDHELAREIDKLLGDDFFDMPGVSLV